VDREKKSLVTAWRLIGWVLAVVAIVVVAGPQILDLVDPRQ
jgi:hypothetical protein